MFQSFGTVHLAFVDEHKIYCNSRHKALLKANSLNVRHGAYIGKIVRTLLLAICCLISFLSSDLSYHQEGLGLNSGFREVAVHQLVALSGLWSLPL